MNPTQPLWTKHWEEFSAALKEKLQEGYLHYGDHSFCRPGVALCDELAAEALDIAGWGLVLWTRIQALKNELKLVEETNPLV